MAARVSVGPELRGDAAGDRAGSIEVVDLGLDRLLAEVPLPVGVGTQQAPIGEVQDAATGMERVPEGKGEGWIAHEPAEVGHEPDLDPTIGRPDEGRLEPPGIPAGRSVMELEIRRADPRPSLGQIELVRLAFGAAAVSERTSSAAVTSPGMSIGVMSGESRRPNAMPVSVAYFTRRMSYALQNLPRCS